MVANIFQRLRETYRTAGVPLIAAKISDKIFKTRKQTLVLQKHILSLSIEELMEYRKQEWKRLTGETLDYLHPQNYGQKMQQILFYDLSPRKTLLADKYRVKEWVKQTIGEEYVIPTLGVWKSFDEIDFDRLPEQFVLKTNHACGMTYVVKNKAKLDRKAAKKDFDYWLKINYGATEACELHYRGIEPLIFAEEYIEQKNGDLCDYKTICILGEPEVIYIIGGRDLEKHTGYQNIFDRDGHMIKQKGSVYPCSEDRYQIPENMDELMAITRKLSQGFDYVRVDLYDVDGKIYFGEMTFTPAALISGAVLHPENWECLSDRAKEFIHAEPKNKELPKL